MPSPPGIGKSGNISSVASRHKTGSGGLVEGAGARQNDAIDNLTADAQ